MILEKELSWVGICTRHSAKQEDFGVLKSVDIPFNFKEDRTRYLLRITKHKSESLERIMYEIHEVVNETGTIMETLLRSKTVNRTSPLMNTILNEKRAKRHYRWLKGWF